ncbi:hypothetical protein MRBLMN1_001020 [Chitinophaga ginsengisegetis]|uniref:hypothetical protein n=1 Tax=Chitinophaga ginsengisegetis TaxID=393003 RepID=UPI00343DCC7B
MKILWCWRCRMELPMLDEVEYKKVYELYGKGIKSREGTYEERFKELMDYYEEVTGFSETIPNAIMHHRIAQYGGPCEKCGKPYRTPLASFCAACGNKKPIEPVT